MGNETFYWDGLVVDLSRVRRFSIFAFVRKVIALEFRHIEINTSSSARIVQLAKTKAITPAFYNVTQSKSRLETETCTITKRRTWY